MRKRTLTIALVTAVTLALAFVLMTLYMRTKVATIVDDERMWDLRDASPQMEVIISEGGMVARYLTEDEDNYIGAIQDSVWIPKSRAMVETWYACEGRGIVYLQRPGEVPAHAEPDSAAPTVGKLVFDGDYLPESYECLGYMDGWFKVGIAGTEGYINEEYVYWDAMDTM